MANRNDAVLDGADASGVTVMQAKACRVRLKKTDTSAMQPTSGKKAESEPDLAKKKSDAPSGQGREYSDVFRCMEELSSRMNDALDVMDVPLRDITSVLRIIDGYKSVVLDLVAENEFLRGKASALEGRSARLGAMPARVNAPPVPAVKPKVSKPVETWSVVVRSHKANATPQEVVKDVVEKVAPTLGVRVHDLKPIRGGGAVIRTRSTAERDKLLKNDKFKEAGLDVAVKAKPGPKIVVQGVHRAITPDEFMEDLYSMNLKEVITPEQFKKTVRLGTAPWTQDGKEGAVAVAIECDHLVAETLLGVGRVYIKWFAFRLREKVDHMGCFRCLSFDHRVSECRMSANVCRRCGQTGHNAVSCTNAMQCRNCAFRGKPAGHLMMSAMCPVYANLLARREARH